MQIPYNKENIKMNFLNAYVKYSYEKDRITLINTIYDKTVFIKCAKEQADKLIFCLQEGIDTEQLLLFLKEISEYDQLYEILLQNFIIE